VSSYFIEAIEVVAVRSRCRVASSWSSSRSFHSRANQLGMFSDRLVRVYDGSSCLLSLTRREHSR
jgi:hypothetical protein